LLKIDGVTHWSIPVTDLEESEKFYGDVLGLEPKGRIGQMMSCFAVGDHRILLCQREEPRTKTHEQDHRVHHAFNVGPKMFKQACKLFHEKKIPVLDLVYRERGFFTGQEMYFLDPSGNKLELRDSTWKRGMPTPTYDEIVRS
jgi:extradiol dioxygenase family protein